MKTKSITVVTINFESKTKRDEFVKTNKRWKSIGTYEALLELETGEVVGLITEKEDVVDIGINTFFRQVI